MDYSEEKEEYETWTCSVCTLINSVDDNRCIVCNASRSGERGTHDDAEFFQSFFPIQETWPCQECTYLNPNTVWRCSSCSMVRSCKSVSLDEPQPPRPLHPPDPEKMGRERKNPPSLGKGKRSKKKKKDLVPPSSVDDNHSVKGGEEPALSQKEANNDSSAAAYMDGKEEEEEEQEEVTKEEPQSGSTVKNDNEEETKKNKDPLDDGENHAEADDDAKNENGKENEKEAEGEAADEEEAPAPPKGVIIGDFDVFDLCPYQFSVPEDALVRVSERLHMPLIRSLEDVSDGALQRLVDPVRCDPYALACDFSPELISEVVWNSGFPMAIDLGEFLFAARLTYRCVLFPLSDLHVQKNARKRSRRFEVTHNAAFDRVIGMIVRQRGFNWICPRLIRAFREIFHNPGKFKLDMHSFEIWSGETLIGVELGYSHGAIYTSLSGGMLREPQYKSAGSVQLALIGMLLRARGFQLWDLGMPLSYKCDLNARTASRDEWLEAHQKHRHGKPESLHHEKMNARELFEQLTNKIESL